MDAKKFVKESAKDAVNVGKRIKNKDFSGNTGQAIKNSSYQLATNLTAKFGSLIFTIIIARMLMPELFGLYGLTLSTVLLFGIFSDLGLGATISTFLSKTIDKKPGKAKSYFLYLIKFKIGLILLSTIFLFIFAKFIANVYYQKPIFYALLVGAIYFLIINLSRIFSLVFMAKNDFKVSFFGEIIFQILRLIILPLLIIYLVSLTIETEIILFWIFVGLAICVLITGIYYSVYYLLKKPFNQIYSKTLSLSERKEIWIFILPLTVTAFSGLFFGYIDIIILGKYVSGEFIGFYQAAFNLITSVSAILGFLSISMFPIFSRLDWKKGARIFRKSRNMLLLISLLSVVVTVILAPWIIKFVYGDAYATSVSYLRVFSVLLVSFPLIGIYQTYFMSQKKTKVISVLLILSTITNIILTLFFINIGLTYGMNQAVIGAGIATIISRYLYLIGLIIYKKIV